MAETLRTYGSFGGFALTLVRESAPANSYNGASMVRALYLIQGADRRLVYSFADDPSAQAGINAAAEAVLAAYAAIGATVALGSAPATPVPASGTAGGSDAYTRAIDLTPGTPVPPGRGVRVYGGRSMLKLAGGGTVPGDDVTGGGGTIIDNLAVVDAVVPSGGRVQILY